jgi:hypothetical protein
VDTTDDERCNEGWLGATSSLNAVLGREAGYSVQVVQWDELAGKGPALFRENLAWDSEPPAKAAEMASYARLVPIPGTHKSLRSRFEPIAPSSLC